MKGISRQLSVFILVPALIVSMWGCGTAIGALAGAAVGYAVDGERGALKGAALGAVVGTIIGYQVKKNQKVKDRQQAVREVGYGGYGYHLSVRNAIASPQRVRPGNKTEVTCEWIAIAPSVRTTLRVDVAYRMVYENVALDSWQKVTKSVEGGGGKVVTSVAVDLPRSLNAGTYQLQLQLTTSGTTAQRFLPIYVVG